MEVVELKIIQSSIACDYMVIQLNFFWTSLPDALGLSLPIQTNTICTTNQNQNLIYRRYTCIPVPTCYSCTCIHVPETETENKSLTSYAKNLNSQTDSTHVV